MCGSEAKEHIGSFKDGCLCPNEKCILFARIFKIKEWNTRVEDERVKKAIEECDTLIDVAKYRELKFEGYVPVEVVIICCDKIKSILTGERDE